MSVGRIYKFRDSEVKISREGNKTNRNLREAPMKSLFVKFSFLLFVSSLAHAAGEGLEPGGRHGLHGMVLFGAGPYFISHIPMNTPPHDFQIVAQVELATAAGEPVSEDFSQTGFTLRPGNTFSLNDYVLENLKAFSGSVHRGSFEMGAPVLPGLEQVTVRVVSFQLVRQIPDQSELSSMQLSDGKNTFDINVITPDSDFQKIVNSQSGKTLWCVKGPDFFSPCQ